MSLKICDAPMGYGKSSSIINLVNKDKGKEKYIIAVPYLSEVDRFVSAAGCIAPDEDKKKGKTKSSDLLSLVKEGKNIVCTHKLSELFFDAVLEECQKQNYTIIFDEFPDILSVVSLTYSNDSDIQNLIRDKKINIDSSNYNKITWIYSNKQDPEKREKEIIELLKSRDLYYIGYGYLVSAFRSKTFEYFKKIIFCTYRYENSYLDYYFKFFDLITPTEDTFLHIEKENDTYFFKDGYDKGYPDVSRIELAKQRYIEDGIKLSKTFCDNAVWDDTKIKGTKLFSLKKKACNFVRNCQEKDGTGVAAILWTTYKYDDKKNTDKKTGTNKKINMKQALIDSQYLPEVYWEACNLLARDDLKERTIVCYLVGLYDNPNIKKFLSQKGIKIDINEFTLRMLIQFIWRSNLRVAESSKKVHILVADMTARKLLVDWIEEAEKYNHI